MTVAILKSDGSAIYIDSFTKPVYDINGFLVGFTNNNDTYKYYQAGDFKKTDRNRYDVEGYYVEKEYLLYISGFTAANDIPGIVEMTSTYKFNFTNIKAKIGDPITASIVNYGVPYNYFYQQQQVSFNIESNTDDTAKVKNYKRAVADNASIIGYEIAAPVNAVIAPPNNVDLHNAPTGYFYAKNFGDNVNNWAISDIEKRKFKRAATLIAFKINSLLTDIFPSLLSDAEMAAVDAIANTTSTDLSSLSDFGKAIFLIKKSWGVYYSPLSDPAYINRRSFDAIFSTDPNYDEFNFYYLALSDFYANAYRRRENLLIMPERDKLNYLLKVLPAPALAIFPFSIVKNLLDQYVKSRSLTDSEQQNLVSILSSVIPANANAYLDYFASMPDCTTTNFEVLYNLLSDARLERIPIINWFVDEVTYRKYFVFAIYSLWQESKYNATYFPPGTPVTGPLNRESYFIQNPGAFVKKHVLTFQTDNFDSNVPNPFHADISFASTFVGDQIDIKRVQTTRIWMTNPNSDPTPLDTSVETPFGVFPMYQPIVLIGYKPNLEFAIPQKCSIPAFLFYYIEEYDRLAEFDAKIALAINLTVVVLGAFFTGGTDVLAELAYLKEFTDVGTALEGSVSSLEEIEVWAGLQESASGLTTTVGALASVNQYLATVTHDENERALLLQNQQLMLLSMILSGGLEAVSGAKLTSIRIGNQANIIKPKITDSPPADFPPLLVQSVDFVIGNTSQTVASIETSVRNLPLGGAANNIYTIFQRFNDAQKLAFWNAFGTLPFESWQELNSGAGVNNWLALYNNGILDASKLDFVTNQKRVNAILYYYSAPQIKSILQALSYNTRLLFLDTYGSAISLETQAGGIQLLLQSQRPLTTGFNVLTTPDVQQILSNNLSENHLALIVQAKQLPLDKIASDFSKNFDTPGISKIDLRIIYNNFQNYFDITTTKGKKALKEFLRSNRLFSTTYIYANGAFIDSVSEVFISGNQAKLNTIFSGASGQLIAEITEPSDWTKFQSFALKASFKEGATASNDTEMKYLFNFMEKHYDRGDQFLISIKSTLYACKNCRVYLQALRNEAILDGKSIKIVFIADPGAIGMADVRDLLELN